MRVRFTEEQAEKLRIAEPSRSFVKPRPSHKEIAHRVELEKLQEKLMEKKVGKNKYRANKTVIDGIKFDSAKEGRRWQELKLLEKAGQITNLERQVNISLEVNGFRVCGMRPDFRYKDEKGVVVVEDVKGYCNSKHGAYAIFRIKKKLFFALTGIDIVEI